MAYQAVLFDCDGVLVDSEIVGLEDATEFLRRQGFDWGPEDFIRRFTGMRTDLFVAKLREAYDRVLGRPVTDEEFAALLNGIIDARRANRHKMGFIEGAHGSVEAARSVGLSVAVASSSAQIYLDSKIERFNFAPLFDGHVYSADYVSSGKPAPDIFLYAAEKVKVSPSECLVIEDSAYGVMAGIASGAEVWGFTGGGHCLDDHADSLREAGATRILSHHNELSSAILEL